MKHSQNQEKFELEMATRHAPLSFSIDLPVLPKPACNLERIEEGYLLNRSYFKTSALVTIENYSKNKY
jgi:hypothetical protein